MDLILNIFQQSGGVVAGSFGQWLLTGHRTPHDVDIWEVKQIPQSFTNVKPQNKWLTKLTVGNVNFDLLKSGCPVVRYMYKPHNVQGFQVLDIRDLGSSKLERICNGMGRKHDYFDLADVLKHTTFAEVLQGSNMLFGRTTTEAIWAATNFQRVEHTENPAYFERNTWAATKQTILDAIK